MTNKCNLKAFLKLPCHFGIFLVFLISICYWIYLTIFSSMLILCDAIGYEYLGKLLNSEGWIEYFKSGPNREPLYPILVSKAMLIAEAFAIPYETVMKIAHLGILSLTFWLIHIFLCRLNVRTWVHIAILLYFGFSPAIINSSLSLYSEIATYPLVLFFILTCISCWDILNKKPTREIIKIALILACSGITLTSVKGIFELIFPFILITLVCLGLYVKIKFQRNIMFHCILLSLIGFSVFQIAITSYKSLNNHYNGQFSITDRGPWALYGNTARRMNDISLDRFLTALSYAPGQGFCYRFFSKEECDYWSFYTSDEMASSKTTELHAQNLPPNLKNATLIKYSKDLALKNPVYYSALSLVEGLKMLFWESTKIGFVQYPEWLSRIFNWGIFKDGLRLLLFIMTTFSLIYSTCHLVKNYKTATEPSEIRKNQILFFILLFIMLFIMCHTIFYVLTRYALTIAPLYLILMGFTLDRISVKLFPINKPH